MPSKNVEQAARMLHKACKEQHSSGISCYGCRFFNKDGAEHGINCFIGYPTIWDAWFPELRNNE